MPYGIQQPAISAQIIQLEEFLGTTLFQRRPFALTPAGQELFEFIRPFFDNLQEMADKIRGAGVQHIRIGASEVVLRDHLPSVLALVRQEIPKLRVVLREGYQPQLQSWLEKRELDMAITLLDARLQPGFQSLPLFNLPLVLLVSKSSKIQNAKQLWAQDRIEQTLISLPTNEAIFRSFQKGLAALSVDWFPSIEVSTVELVENYVANGYGIGLSVVAPKGKPHHDLRMLPLDGFDSVTFGVLWQGRATPIVETFLGAIKKVASSMGLDEKD
jgi:DNA-binding transcriptional LysR family regulator